MPASKISWDFGTAYDFFISLEVVHNPAEFNLRAQWAAGVRARIPAPLRAVIEDSLQMFHIPFAWISRLPEPKDGHTLLWTLRQTPPEQRLAELALHPELPPEYAQILTRVTSRRQWDDDDQEALTAVYQRIARENEGKKVPAPARIRQILEWWRCPAEFGERLLDALHEYYDAFFRREESRIRPALLEAQTQAQAKARELSFSDLMEQLTQGVRFEELPAGERAVLAPSYWCTPFVFYGRIDPKRTVYLYGARPAEASLVPGEPVPDALLHTQKALSDPTRLQILQYLNEQPLSPSELSRRLRLRVPTVVHHLRVLRLAGLIRLNLGENAVTKSYSARPEAIETAYLSLKRFLKL